MKSAKTWEVKQRKKGPVSKGLPHHLHHNKIKQMRMPDGTKKKVKHESKKSIEEKDAEDEMIRAEKEVERLAKSSKTMDRSKSSSRASRSDSDRQKDNKSPRTSRSEADHSTDRSKSSVRASRSETDQSKNLTSCLKKPSRSKSESRVKDISHKSFSDLKDRLKKQAEETKVRKVREKAEQFLEDLEEVAEVVKVVAITVHAAWDSDADSDDLGAVGGIENTEDIYIEEDVPQMVTDLAEKFQDMDVTPRTRKRSGRSRDEGKEDDDDGPQPRKLLSPELRPESQPTWLEY